MHWFIESVIKPWHPTIIGVAMVAAVLYCGLEGRPREPSNASDPVFEETAPDGCVRLADCRRIAVGMTESDVHWLMRIPGEPQPQFRVSDPSHFAKKWRGVGFQLYVVFGGDGKVLRFATWAGC